MSVSAKGIWQVSMLPIAFREECQPRGGLRRSSVSSGNNIATARSVTGVNLPQEAASEFAPAEVQSLLTQVGQGIDSLIPRSEARFLPDSVVGSITLEVDGKEATFYFLVDEEERQAQEKEIAPAMVEAIDNFSKFSEQLLQQGGINMAISVKGVARHYRGIAGGFSVNAAFGKGFLRPKLVALARQNHQFNFSECIYGGTAAFEQTWSHIIIRIRLNPDAGISDATMNTLKSTWREGDPNDLE